MIVRSMISMILVVNCVCTQETGTTGWELEGFHSEGEVLIIGIIDYEAVVDGLLQALCLITLRHKRAGITRSQTLLNAGSLGESFIVSFNVVDDNSPFALGVDSAQRPDVGSLRGTEVCLFLQGSRPLNGQLSVEVSYISIEALELLEMMFNGSLDLISWVLFIFKAPGLGVVDRASRRISVMWVSRFVGSRLLVMVGWSVMI